MLQFKLEIVLTGIRSKTDLLDNSLLSIRFNFLLFFLLFVNEFTVIDNLTNRRRSIRRNFNQIQLKLIS
ncbi:Uncharacterised protein [Mycobacterium tuberculosis]|nr:Uncharacterised protein [Mycobacterium tuberculosis]